MQDSSAHTRRTFSRGTRKWDTDREKSLQRHALCGLPSDPSDFAEWNTASLAEGAPSTTRRAASFPNLRQSGVVDMVKSPPSLKAPARQALPR
jgi:hypothetical protein